ncbi:MAG: hypothetical protein V8R75_02860, partial [Oscillospiraceae bacterium]
VYGLYLVEFWCFQIRKSWSPRNWRLRSKEPLPPMEEPEQSRAEEPPASTASLQYAQVQADQMLLEARRQAENSWRMPGRRRKDARRCCTKTPAEAAGKPGHAEGVSQGSAQALEENRHVCEEKMKTLSGEVARFRAGQRGAGPADG